MKKNLSEWLSHIESLHPKTIMMGLDRVREVMARLKLAPNFRIVTIAGTNGKGSTTAMLEKIYHLAGYRVGCYTSPHLLRYNERLRINLQEVDDEALCHAFESVERARINRESIELTYFEFGTLAAIWHLMQAQVDVAVLEIGLGGRLDAVNAFDSDCAIVTNVDLDHQDYLGDTREKIGFEKAGVYRQGKPAIFGDLNPPQTLVDYANKVHADLMMVGQAFIVRAFEGYWQYQRHTELKTVDYELPYPALFGDYQLNNAACALTAVSCLQKALPVPVDTIKSALQTVTLPGRFERLSTPNAEVIFDVAHNPHAAQALCLNLTKIKSSSRCKIIAVFAMLSDKDIAGVIGVLKEVFDAWYIADIEQPRGAKAVDVEQHIKKVLPTANIQRFASAGEAFVAALSESQCCKDNDENAKIVVFGSFYTVANVKQWLFNHPNLTT